MNSKNLLEGYDLDNLTIGCLGGHSALEVSLGAKKQGFRTVVVARRDRAQTYAKHLRTDDNTMTGCVDEVILVDNFDDILKPEIQKRLRELNTIFVHSRYFWVYFKDFAKVEKDFAVPILGTRELLRLEERDESPNQYDVLEAANIRLPKIFKIPELELRRDKFAGPDNEYSLSFSMKVGEDIALEKPGAPKMNRLTLTKINNATRTYERENFVANSWREWMNIAAKKIQLGEITFEDLQKCTIEEFILGAQINFNFFYSPLSDRLELLGTDMRRQTNLDGWLRLPANEQLKLTEAGVSPSHIETGHVACTVKESLLEKAFEAGEKFVETCKEYDKVNGKGMIGPFALQGAIETDGKKEELVVFDVSFRMPGSPGMSATPYSSYLFGRTVSMGERIAMEVAAAKMSGKLGEILT